MEGTVADIERTFNLTLRAYRHPVEPRTFYAPDADPSIAVTVPVLDISGLDDYVVPRPMLRKVPLRAAGNATPNAGSGPGGSYMGYDFRAAYAPGVTLTGSGQSVGLLQFDGYYAGDIAAYETQAGLPNVPLTNVLLDGFSGTPGVNNSEVALDIEMAISMAPGLTRVIVYESGPSGIPTDVLNRMATDNLAKQLSSSWTWSPFNSTTEQIFQQFAAQGQSFFNASGDSDAYASTVSKPADDPYITIVGGTTLSTTGAGGSWVSETVWNWGTGTGSGGGISTTYPIPSWQQGISMSANQGSTTLRNLPDVALTADNVYVIYDNGGSDAFGGTSCATPLWAGFTALINEQALINGRPTVGFINPAVYAIGKGPNYASCFRDTTTGNNFNSGSPTRFSAVSGYDLCTGWGTPTGSNLINALSAPLPPTLQITPTNGLTAAGPAGGPFLPSNQVYALSNSGGTPLVWHASKTADWLSVSATDGTLAAGSSANVTVSLSAGSLGPGSYSDWVSFTNMTSGLGNSTRPVTLTVTPPRILFFPLDTDPGWPRLGQWAFGHPAGFGGTRRGFPDPGNGATGTNVFGVNLSGDYSTSVGGPYYLTAGPLNFSGYANVTLQFQRWLNTFYPPSVYATIDVSSNGTAWTQVFSNAAGVALTDSAWTRCQYDISAVADHQSNVYVRWGHRIASSGTRAYSGWNVDDIEFLGVPTSSPLAHLVVSSPYGGAAPGTVSTNPGTALSEWITNSPVVNGATQYVCSGATLAGNSFTQVSPTNVTLTLTNNATLTWLWTTNYYLAIQTVKVYTPFALAIPGTTNVPYGAILNETVTPLTITTTPGTVRVRVIDVKINGNDAVVTP